MMSDPVGLNGKPSYDLTGIKFGFLNVLHKHSYDGKNTKWLCLCVCGNQHIATTGNLRKKTGTKSCGCHSSRLTVGERSIIHGEMRGKKSTIEYRTWQSMKRRCYNEKNPKYYRYGLRGIKICDRWLYGEDKKTGYQCFLKDMGRHPVDKTSIDRINNDGNYSPENCRWATAKEQAGNVSTNRWIEFDGKKMILANFCELLSLKQGTVWSILKTGMKPKELYERTKKSGGSFV